ncbi:TonB-dependent receptor [Lichenicola sp.]|uniref:TonB-dependent receptor n=1 Tax=Lichenicola sp. TaxID=2804529 RepID=UPI003AFFBC12
MPTIPRPSRRTALHGATAMIIVGLSYAPAWAQVSSETVPSGIPKNAGTGQPTTANGNTPSSSETITVRAQKRLLREKDAPSAVTELGAAAISQVGVQGSVATLLRQAPSVNVYQQGIGDNEPVLTIRGIRGSEVASTLDGVPTQDLLSGGSGSFLSDIVGSHFNLDQISGVSIYPGVAFPDHSTFGTIGGTVAYTSLRPDNKAGADLFGSVGSFKTFNEGFDVNSGRLDGPLGTGVDAPKFMLKYSNLQTSGYIDYTPARYNNMEFAFDKPYDQGQSLFQLTTIYNTANALITPEPVPTPYTQQNGAFSNYNPGQEFFRQNNDYFTLILKNDTYINDYLSAGLTGFYLYSDSYTQDYANPTVFAPNGGPGSAAVGGANPFIQTPAGFGEQGDYGYGNFFYEPTAYPYNPNLTANCPASVTNSFAAAGQTSPCGTNSEYLRQHNDTYGIQPHVSITPPEIFGINNTIHIGGIIAKETENGPNGGQAYLGTTSEFAHTTSNQIQGFDGGGQRTIYNGYAQDKIDLLHNTLHITPGVTLQTSDSSENGTYTLNATPSPATQQTAYYQEFGDAYGPYKVHKWDRTWLPFLNASYDLDKVVPALRGVSLYASYGTSALFAPIGDYTPNAVPGAGPPNASIVHMYEAGIKYNRNNLSLNFDYFYQHVTRDFGFFQYQSGPFLGQEVFTNDGQREFKGIEASAIYQITPRWQVFGNVSYTLAKYLETSLASVTVQEDQFGLAIRGAPISGIPDWLSTFGVDYDHKSLALPNDELNVRFEGQYTGHQYTTIDGNGFQNLGPIPGLPYAYGSYNYYNATSGQTFTNTTGGGISPFAIFNLDMNYKMPIRSAGPLKSLDFDLNVQNIFNQGYFQYFYNQETPASCGNFTSGPFKGKPISNYGCSAAFNDGLPGEPAAVTFTVKAHF